MFVNDAGIGGTPTQKPLTLDTLVSGVKNMMSTGPVFYYNKDAPAQVKAAAGAASSAASKTAGAVGDAANKAVTAVGGAASVVGSAIDNAIDSAGTIAKYLPYVVGGILLVAVIGFVRK